MKKILYVEDNADTAEAVKIILSKAGFDIQIANSGKECIEIIKDKGFDLFLLDVMLPDMSGWDIFEKLKGKTGDQIAFLSAISFSPERMKELRKAGISDYITKPFRKDDLIKRIKIILKG